MGIQHTYAINGVVFSFFRKCSVVLDYGWRLNFPKMEMVYFVRSHDSSFLQHNVYHLHQIKISSVFVP